jgi:hypothetical protein
MNGLNNTRDNLRAATSQQQNQNQNRQVNNQSGFKGVCWNRSKKLYSAQIQVDGRRVALGYSTTPQAAARMYDVAALVIYGDFANINGVYE